MAIQFPDRGPIVAATPTLASPPAPVTSAPTPPPPVTTPAATFDGKTLAQHGTATPELAFGNQTAPTASHDTSDAGVFLASRPGLTPFASDADERILNLPNRTQRENASLVRAATVGRATDGVQVYVRIKPSGGDGSVRMATVTPTGDLRRTLAFSPRQDKVASLQLVLDSGLRVDVRPTGALHFPKDFNARDLSDKDYAFLCQARDQGLIDDMAVLEGLDRLGKEGGVGLSRADLDALLPKDSPWLKAGAGLVGALGGWGLSRMRAELQVKHDPNYPLNRDKPLDQWGTGTLAVENNAPIVASGGHFMHTAALASLLPGVLGALYTDVGKAVGSLMSSTSKAAGDKGAQDKALGQISQGVSTFIGSLSDQEGGVEALRTRLQLALGKENGGRIDAYLAWVQQQAADLKQPNLPEPQKAAIQSAINDATRQLVEDCGKMPSHFLHDAGSATGAAFKSGYAVYLMYLSGEEFEVSKNPKAYLAAFNPFMSPVEVKTPWGGYATRNDWAGDVTVGNMPGAAFQIVSENIDKDGHVVVSDSGPLGKGGGGDHTPNSIPLPTTAEITPDYASRVEVRNDWGGFAFGSSVRSAMGQSGLRDRDILGRGSPVDAMHSMSGGFHSLSWGIDPNSAVNRMKSIQPGTRMWSVGAHFNPGAVFNGLSGTVLQNAQIAAEFTTGTAPGQHVDPSQTTTAMDAITARQSLLHLRADLPMADLTGTIAASESESTWAAIGNYLGGGVNHYLEHTRVGVSYGHNWGAVDPGQHLAARPGGQFAFTTRTEVLSLNGQESTMELIGKIGWGLLSGILSYGSNSGVAAMNTAINGRRL
jgi:hypothetical protein